MTRCGLERKVQDAGTIRGKEEGKLIKEAYRPAVKLKAWVTRIGTGFASEKARVNNV